MPDFSIKIHILSQKKKCVLSCNVKEKKKKNPGSALLFALALTFVRVLSWLGSHPSTKSCENRFSIFCSSSVCSYCVMLQTSKQPGWKQHSCNCRLCGCFAVVYSESHSTQRNLQTPTFSEWLGWLPKQPEYCTSNKSKTDNEIGQLTLDVCFSVVRVPPWTGNIMEPLKRAHSNFDISSGLRGLLDLVWTLLLLLLSQRWIVKINQGWYFCCYIQAEWIIQALLCHNAAHALQLNNWICDC